MHGLSDAAMQTLITTMGAVLIALMGLLFKKVGQVHRLVNSAATAQQLKIDAAAKEIVTLNGIVLKLSTSLQELKGREKPEGA